MKTLYFAGTKGSATAAPPLRRQHPQKSKIERFMGHSRHGHFRVELLRDHVMPNQARSNKEGVKLVQLVLVSGEVLPFWLDFRRIPKWQEGVGNNAGKSQRQKKCAPVLNDSTPRWRDVSRFNGR